MIERAVVFTAGTTIGADLIPEAIRSSHRLQPLTFEMPPGGIPFRTVIEEMETMLIARALDAAGGIQKRAAELLQVKPTTLNEMIKRYGIPARGRRSQKAASGGDPRPPVAARAGQGSRSRPEAIAADLLEKRLSSRG
ncbi:MAG: hypothetical protein OXF27_19845 [Acidobacteria bacterium]|nr:hypothetical protein [Acidobacteriota bacterium]